jgi:hypothetical protein
MRANMARGSPFWQGKFSKIEKSLYRNRKCVLRMIERGEGKQTTWGECHSAGSGESS